MPTNLGAISFVSRGRIASAVCKRGELTHADEELEWADNEDEPCEISVVDTGGLVEPCESRAKLFEQYSATQESTASEEVGEENRHRYKRREDRGHGPGYRHGYN